MVLKRTSRINTNKFFIILVLSFVAIQLISWLLSEFMDYPILKGGPILLLFLVVIGIITLFVLGKNITQLTFKKEGLFILLVFGLIILSFVYLPKYIPQIFSTTSIQFRQSLEEIVQAIVRLSPGGIVPA